MLRQLTAYLLSALLLLAGFSLADVRGQDPVIGAEVVLCSGTTFTTITLGPDGQPVGKTAPCPDGTALFSATFALPDLAAPTPRLLRLLSPAAPLSQSPQNRISPSARDPPRLI